MRNLNAETLHVTHDHVGRRTRIVKKLRDHVIQEFPWIDGILTRRQALEKTQISKPEVVYNPVSLKSAW